jgi:hypothetical protein
MSLKRKECEDVHIKQKIVFIRTKKALMLSMRKTKKQTAYVTFYHNVIFVIPLFWEKPFQVRKDGKIVKK